MKIGFVFDDSLDKPDGIQQYMWSLADFYTSQGHEVHYLVGQTNRTDIPNVHSLSRNINVQFNGNRLSIPLWAAKRRVRQLLAKEQFDVLHVQVPYHPLMAGRIISAAPSTTVVFGTFHVAPYSRLVVVGNYLLGRWCRRSLRRFDTMVSVSSAAQKLCRQTFGLDTQIVPNVFDYARFHHAQQLPQYDDDTKTIMFLGRLVPRKGCLLLLQAVVLLQASAVSKYRVVICGRGPLEVTLKAFVAKHSLDKIVSFAGWISEADKPRYMASADVAVFPSSAGESFGIVLIEAMASGRAAVLGGDNPGYRSVLQQRPGQLFNTAKPDELAAKLVDMLTNEQLRSETAAWGTRASQQYDAQIVGAQLLDLYQPSVQNSRNR